MRGGATNLEEREQKADGATQFHPQKIKILGNRMSEHEKLSLGRDPRAQMELPKPSDQAERAIDTI